MTKTLFQKSQIIIFSAFFLLGGVVTQVYAEDINLSVTGNGAQSQNVVDASSNNQTVVQQNNNATVTNTVTETNNTGGNSASSNTDGNTSITTGGINSQSAVENNINSSHVSTGCCPTNSGGTSVTVSGNGAFSQNTVSTATNNVTNISVSQNANIYNNINKTLTTGLNSADFNTGGNVSIHTGNIVSNTTVRNVEVNKAKVNLGVYSNSPLLLTIFGNGAFSRNTVSEFYNKSLTVTTENVANIINNVVEDLMTGGNSADFNTGGNTSLITGSAFSNVNIANQLNSSQVTISCCQQKPEQQPPASNTTPSTTVAVASAPAPTSPVVKAGEVLAAAVGNILPVTGNNWLLFIIFANVVMLFLGMYLRLRSGRAPSVVAA